MDTPEYVLLYEDPQTVVDQLRADVGPDLVSFFTSSNELDFLDLLTPDALAKVNLKFGANQLIGDNFRDSDVDGGDTPTPIGLVIAASTPNPNRFFAYDPDTGFAEEDARPRGAFVPLRADPGILKDFVVPVTGLRISFAADGAPAQQHRDPGRHGGATFQRRTEALARIGRTTPPERKNRVHVFVVDQGMDPHYVNELGGPGTYRGVVWDTYPIVGPTGMTVPLSPKPQTGELPLEHRHRYRSMPNWHAHMIVRNILSVAGDNRGLEDDDDPWIRFYDVPVIPNRVGAVIGTALQLLLQALAIWSKKDQLSDPENLDRFIIVNAWGVKNRLRESPLGSLTDREAHPLNNIVRTLADQEGVAVVFAAGNTGQFTPDPEASAYDRGPGRGIWYPNRLANVLNAGACDTTGKWIGASSQGAPEVPIGSAPQPLFCTPSYFREDLDAHVMNTGSSASCGLLAGLIAARWRQDPKALNVTAARAAARRYGHSAQSTRLGWGVPQDGTF